MNAPQARYLHAAASDCVGGVGTTMVVWGGANPALGGANRSSLSTGGVYDFAGDAWRALGVAGAPAGLARDPNNTAGSEGLCFTGPGPEAWRNRFFFWGGELLRVTNAGGFLTVGAPFAKMYEIAGAPFTTGQPAEITAGDAFGPLTIRATDQFGNVIPEFAGSVELLVDGAIAGPGAFGPAVNGVITVPAGSLTAPTEAGAHALALRDSQARVTTALPALVVKPGPLDHFAIVGLPTHLIAGDALPDLVIRASDRFGNTLPSYNGLVLVFANGNPVFEVPLGPFTQGILQIPGGFLVEDAGAFSITLRDLESGVSTNSSQVHVSPGPVVGYTVSPPPPTFIQVGAPLGPFLLQAVDRFGNVNPDYDGSVQVVLGGGVEGTFGPFVEGEFTIPLFPEGIDEPGVYTLVLRDTGGAAFQVFPPVTAFSTRVRKLILVAGMDALSESPGKNYFGVPMVAVAGETFDRNIVVQVLDETNRPVSGMDVLFEVDFGPVLIAPGVSASMRSSDATGAAHITLVAGATAGAAGIRISMPTEAGSNTILTTARVVPPIRRLETLERYTGEGQVGVVGQLVDTPLRVRAIDNQGQPMEGVDVSFRGPGVFSPMSPNDSSRAVTDELGVAGVNYRLPSTGVDVHVECLVVGDDAPSVMFNLTAVYPKVAIAAINPSPLPHHRSSFVVEMTPPRAGVEVLVDVIDGPGRAWLSSHVTDDLGRITGYYSADQVGTASVELVAPEFPVFETVSGEPTPRLQIGPFVVDGRPVSANRSTTRYSLGIDEATGAPAVMEEQVSGQYFGDGLGAELMEGSFQHGVAGVEMARPFRFRALDANLNPIVTQFRMAPAREEPYEVLFEGEGTFRGESLSPDTGERLTTTARDRFFAAVDASGVASVYFTPSHTSFQRVVAGRAFAFAEGDYRRVSFVTNLTQSVEFVVLGPKLDVVRRLSATDAAARGRQYTSSRRIPYASPGEASPEMALFFEERTARSLATSPAVSLRVEHPDGTTFPELPQFPGRTSFTDIALTRVAEESDADSDLYRSAPFFFTSVLVEGAITHHEQITDRVFVYPDSSVVVTGSGPIRLAGADDILRLVDPPSTSDLDTLKSVPRQYLPIPLDFPLPLFRSVPLGDVMAERVFKRVVYVPTKYGGTLSILVEDGLDLSSNWRHSFVKVRENPDEGPTVEPADFMDFPIGPPLDPPPAEFVVGVQGAEPVGRFHLHKIILPRAATQKFRSGATGVYEFELRPRQEGLRYRYTAWLEQEQEIPPKETDGVTSRRPWNIDTFWPFADNTDDLPPADDPGNLYDAVLPDYDNALASAGVVHPTAGAWPRVVDVKAQTFDSQTATGWERTNYWSYLLVPDDQTRGPQGREGSLRGHYLPYRFIRESDAERSSGFNWNANPAIEANVAHDIDGDEATTSLLPVGAFGHCANWSRVAIMLNEPQQTWLSNPTKTFDFTIKNPPVTGDQAKIVSEALKGILTEIGMQEFEEDYSLDRAIARRVEVGAGRPTHKGNLIPRTSIPSQGEMNEFEEWERVEGFHEFLVRHLLVGFEQEQGPADRAKPLAVWGNLGADGQPYSSLPDPTPTGGFGEFNEWNHPIWGFFARYRQTDLRDLGRTDILARTKSAEDLRPGYREDLWNYVIYFTEKGSLDVGNANRRAEWLTWPVDHGQRRHYFIEKRINDQVVKVWLKWLIPMLVRTKSGNRSPPPLGTGEPAAAWRQAASLFFLGALGKRAPAPGAV
ncbi:MAG: hypothetical protein HY719_16225, partial [Planctomycetes bacterium]|nr:hypothetical protein [Planctomycetota bacterium]